MVAVRSFALLALRSVLTLVLGVIAVRAGAAGWRVMLNWKMLKKRGKRKKLKLITVAQKDTTTECTFCRSRLLLFARRFSFLCRFRECRCDLSSFSLSFPFSLSFSTSSDSSLVSFTSSMLMPSSSISPSSNSPSSL